MTFLMVYKNMGGGSFNFYFHYNILKNKLLAWKDIVILRILLYRYRIFIYESIGYFYHLSLYNPFDRSEMTN